MQEFVRYGSGPSVVNSTLSTAVSSQKWITCTIEPHQRPWKEKVPHLKSWTCLEIPPCCTCWYKSVTLLSNVEKGCCRGVQLCRQLSVRGRWWVPKLRPVVQHTDRQVKAWKKADCFTLLRRITRLKTVNSEIKSKDQISYLERYSPKGSCHHDESSMSHTLAQNCHCEFCCGVHLTWKKHSRYTWQEWIDERTWKPVKTAIAIVSAKWSEWEADPSPFNKAISLPTWQIAKIVQTLKWPQIGWKKLKLVEKRRGGSWANHVPWPESKILQVRRDDQSRYPPSSRVTSLVGHRPLLKLEVLHLFRCFTHTRTYIHTYIPYLPTYLHTYIHKYIHKYIYICIYIYIYIHL